MNKDTLFILVKRNEGVNLCEMVYLSLYLISINAYLCNVNFKVLAEF